jgi:YD repeat-containing protein
VLATIDRGPSCDGNPVRLWDGAMLYNDRDPLPGRALDRRYSSANDAVGVFGTGWYSLFDAGVVRTNTPWYEALIVYDENRNRRVFNRVFGTWVEDWPTARTRGASTLTGSETEGYRLREAGSSLVREFGTNHHLTGLLDLATNRRMSITYDGAGLPTHVTDQNGNWSWTVTTNSGRVTQLAVDARPDIVWQYTYSGSLLQSVGLQGVAPPWRS